MLLKSYGEERVRFRGVGFSQILRRTLCEAMSFSPT